MSMAPTSTGIAPTDWAPSTSTSAPTARAARAAPATSSTAPVAHDTCDSATRRVRGPLTRATACSRSPASPSGSIRRITAPYRRAITASGTDIPGCSSAGHHDLVAGAPVDAPGGHVDPAGCVGGQGDLVAGGADRAPHRLAQELRRGGRALEARAAAARASQGRLGRRRQLPRRGRRERPASAGVEVRVGRERGQLCPHGLDVRGHGPDRSRRARGGDGVSMHVALCPSPSV